MPYFIGYLLLFIILSQSSFFELSPALTWIFGYIILFLTIWKKNPLDPQAWMFFSWGILFVNVFSGAIYVPISISFIEPICYVSSVLFMFHIGFKVGEGENFRFNKFQIRQFLSVRATRKLQLFMTIFGLISILGAISISFEMFVLHGMSMNGGDRRSQFQQTTLTPLTTIGVILLGGSYFSALSLFFGGNPRNKLIAIFALCSIALSSIAIAGKQGILISVLIVVFGILMASYYKVKIKFPIHIKLLLIVVSFGLSSYIISLSSERHGNVNTAELFLESERLSPSFVKEMNVLPDQFKNLFAEYFGYYGDQLCTFSERWELDTYATENNLFAFPPKILSPFTWVERQVIKIFPFYSELYPTIDLYEWIDNQRNGYFGLANWQTTLQQGIISFGLFGLWIVVFIHGYLSRRLYERTGTNMTFATLHLSLLNSIFLVYTIMMNFLGETSAFFYFVIILGLYYNERNNSKKLLRLQSH